MERTPKPFYVPSVLPRCLKDLAQEPPMCSIQEKDFQAIQALREYGRSLGCSDGSIKQACDLASGTSDLVIILERPRSEQSHPTNQSFEDFVTGCDTLKAVDELIRFATRGTRNICTVTVIDAFSFQPDKKDTAANLKCEEFLCKFLKIKKPSVILHCLNTTYQSLWMEERFIFGKPFERIQEKNVDITDRHRAIVIPSFHPSRALFWDQFRLELRVLSLYHFAFAVRLLHDERPTDCCSNRILKMCHLRGELIEKENNQSISEVDLAYCISSKLEISFSKRQNDVAGLLLSRHKFADESISDRIKQESDAFVSQASWLTNILQKPHDFDLFGIAYVVFQLAQRKNKFPLFYSQISSTLLEMNIGRDHWFCNIGDANVVEVQESLAQVRLNETPVVQEIIDSNLKAHEAVLQIIKVIARGEGVVATAKKIIRAYRAVDEQNKRIIMHLANTNQIGIVQVLETELLLKRCYLIIDYLYAQGQWKEALPDEIFDQVSRLLECLTELKFKLHSLYE